MKNKLILIAIAISISAAGQQHIVTYWYAFKQYKQEDYFLDSKGEKNGKYTAYFTDGSINALRTYKNNEIDGKETLYYNDETGRGMAHIYNYKNGKQDGLQQSYIEPSQGEYYFKYVRTEEFYKDGYMTWRKTYDVDGKNKRCLRKEELFKSGDYDPYLTKGYRQNGRQFYQTATDGFNWQDAAPTGGRIEWYTVKGKKDGLYKEWYPNGQLGDSCYYNADVSVGIEVMWDEKGNIIKNVRYEKEYEKH